MKNGVYKIVLYSMYALKLFFIALIFILTSCLEIEELPIIPHIEFKSFSSFEARDTLGNMVTIGELIFELEDGDGDIGREGRSVREFADSSNSDVFITQYNKVEGEYIKDTTQVNLYYILPTLDPEGFNKTLKGEVKIEIVYYIIEYDTIQYKFYIVDKAYHKSNVVTTPDLVFNN
ncbi:hypothetical protein ACFLSA_02255 [Bacteroidota bacterium]